MSDLVLPDYGGPCITNIVPALLGPPDELPSWVPSVLAEADQVVLFVVDGLGWEQLQARIGSVPTLATMEGGPITTVAPSTTATALTSLTTGLPPGRHGVVGYRVAVHGEVLNILRWSTAAGDARQSIPPAKFQPNPPFLGERPPVVTRAEYRTSGFTGAHLDPARFWGYRTLSTMVTEVDRRLRASEPFVYAYWDGLDKVAHEYGLGEHYDAELTWIDHTIDRLLAILPRRAALVVTADHGQVDVGDHVVDLRADVLALCSMQSGEGRFRWLHARAGRAGAAVRRGARRPPRRRLGRHPRPGGRRGLVRARGDRRRARPAGRRGARRPARRGLPRSARHGAVPARGAARVDDVGRDVRAAARRHPLTTAARGERRARDPAVTWRGRKAGPAVAGWAPMSYPEQPATTNGGPTGAGEATPQVEHAEVVSVTDQAGGDEQTEAVEQPAKVMRIGSMIKLLLEEVRQTDTELDEASRDRLREIYETSVAELSSALSPDLRDELGRLAHPFAGEAAPSGAELRIAKAQLVGWLEGLFHGIQATLFAQQMAARQQLDDMRRRLPPGAPAPGGETDPRPGTYL